MIQRHPYGRVSSDRTQTMDIKMDKVYTAREFIEEVVKTYPNEWGYFTIAEKKSDHGHHYSYKYRTITPGYADHPEIDLEVLYVEASGGWTRMNYTLYLRRE